MILETLERLKIGTGWDIAAPTVVLVRFKVTAKHDVAIPPPMVQCNTGGSKASRARIHRVFGAYFLFAIDVSYAHGSGSTESATTQSPQPQCLPLHLFQLRMFPLFFYHPLPLRHIPHPLLFPR